VAVAAFRTVNHTTNGTHSLFVLVTYHQDDADMVRCGDGATHWYSHPFGPIGDLLYTAKTAQPVTLLTMKIHYKMLL
jgi:hypothetical protein